MYAHPSFQRGHPENLVLLRKLTTAADRRRSAEKLAQKIKKQEGEKTTCMPTPPMSQFATLPSPPLTPPQRMDSSGVVTDYSSSSYSCAASVCSATSTFAPSSSYGDVEQVIRTTYNISIPKLIETYQKSVDVKPFIKVSEKRSSSCGNDASKHESSNSADFLEGNKLALLAMAMTSMAGQEVSS